MFLEEGIIDEFSAKVRQHSVRSMKPVWLFDE
jgi:hypothetical protein